MAARTPNGAAELKKALKTGELDQLYLIYGEEDYLKKYYLRQIRDTLVNEEFAQFNLVLLEGKGLTPETLSEAVESYPAFAERKLIVVTDLDLYKPPAGFQDMLIELLQDLPDYVCLVFYYDMMPFKADRRKKIHALLEKKACIADFPYLSERELISWVRRRVHALGKDIDQETCAYLLFLCGTSMTNLISEIEKAAAHATVDEIGRYHIDEVCTRVLDAVVFDLTDAITANEFARAIAIVHDLFAQKNNEVMIFSAVLRHIQRLYAAKLSAQARGSSKELMALIGSGSSFYAQKLSAAARSLSLAWLRQAVQICGYTDAALKSSAADKHKIVELALLQMAADSEGKDD